MSELPPGISRTQDPGGRDALRLEGSGGKLLVAVLGAQVLSWQGPLGEVLWCGSNAEYAPAKPVRGGVPLVFPWFGDHATDKKLPAHGFARTLTWSVADAKPGPELVLACQDDASTRAMWPHAFVLRLSIALRDRLQLQLTVRNTGASPLRCEEALHTYFAVGDVHTASVHGLEGVPFTETATAPEAAWDTKSPLRFRAETDRVFHGTPDRLELRAPALQRTIAIATQNARSAIVWNPWPAKTAKLSQMSPDDWQRFCCVESANVRQHALTVAPGASHTLSLALDCRRT
jgi:glucose-6-phosphate 1-epimerase